MVFSSWFVFGGCVGFVCVVSCSSNSNPPPSLERDPLIPASCNGCQYCGCPDTGNTCTYYLCQNGGPPYYWRCNLYGYTDGRACSDLPAHQRCVVSGHCETNGSGNCSATGASGENWYTCATNGSCSCGTIGPYHCTYNQGTNFYDCCDNGTPGCGTSCLSSEPSCNAGQDNADGTCRLTHHCF